METASKSKTSHELRNSSMLIMKHLMWQGEFEQKRICEHMSYFHQFIAEYQSFSDWWEVAPAMAITLDFNCARKTLSRFTAVLLFWHQWGFWMLLVVGVYILVQPNDVFLFIKMWFATKLHNCCFKPDLQHKIDWKIFKLKDNLDRFPSPLVVRPMEASDGFHTIGDVMPLTTSAHVVACATTDIHQSFIYSWLQRALSRNINKTFLNSFETLKLTIKQLYQETNPFT